MDGCVTEEEESEFAQRKQMESSQLDAAQYVILPAVS